MSNVNNLREAFIKAFSAHYELNDPAHRVEHFMEVEFVGHYIQHVKGTKYNPDLITTFAFTHDLFAWDREKHHELSSFWVRTTEHPIIKGHFNEEERLMLSQACAEHRASYKGEYSSLFSQICACADRGHPGSVWEMIDRSCKYPLAKGLACGEREALEMAVAHVKEKFGTGGYARYPELYMEIFKKELKAQQEEIDKL